MARLELVPAHSPVLKAPVRKWTFESHTGNLVKKLIKVMRKHGGVGIAANQVGLPIAICVVETDEGPLALINPELRKKWDIYKTVEGCLSLPGQPHAVKRYKGIEISFQNEEGEFKELSLLDPVISQRIQHEIDHLNGIMINDYCSHRRCICNYVSNRQSMTIEQVMSLIHLKDDLGVGDL